MATFTIYVSTMARRAIYTGGNQGTVYEVDATITYTPAVSLQATIAALDATVTYSLLQGQVTALDATVTYNLLQGQIAALDAEVTYALLQGQITALDATLTYGLLQSLISALDATISYGTFVEPIFILPGTGSLVIDAPSTPNMSASLFPAATDAGTPGSIGVITVESLPTENAGLARYTVGDIYWRIWCIPAFMNPAVPARNVNIPFTVWQAYPYDNTLNTIGGTGQDGLTLDLTTPRDFFPVEELVVNLQITDLAPITIAATYLFNFSHGQGVFRFEATTLEWMWILPEQPVVETWDWLSNVITAWDSTEQRISIRRQPRRRVEYEILLEDDAAKAREYDRWFKYLRSSVLVPYYQYATRITQNSNIGDYRIYFDPARTDLRDQDFVVILRPSTDETFLLQLGAVETDGAFVLTPLTVAINQRDLIAPAFLSRLDNRTGPQMSSVSGTLRIQANALETRSSLSRPGSTAIITQFDSLDVLDRRPLARNMAEEVVDINPTIIDNESGTSDLKSSWIHAFIDGARMFSIARMTQPIEMDYWRDFLNNRVGQRNSFLLPTWRRDLVLDEIPDPADSQLILVGTTYNNQYYPYDTYKRLQLKNSAGAVLYRKVTASETITGERSMITISPALPDDIAWSEDFNISFLNRVRLVSDQVRLSHFTMYTLLELVVKTVDQ